MYHVIADSKPRELTDTQLANFIAALEEESCKVADHFGEHDRVMKKLQDLRAEYFSRHPQPKRTRVDVMYFCYVVYKNEDGTYQAERRDGFEYTASRPTLSALARAVKSHEQLYQKHLNRVRGNWNALGIRCG